MQNIKEVDFDQMQCLILPNFTDTRRHVLLLSNLGQENVAMQF